MTDSLANLVGGLPSQVQSVQISETMRPEAGGFSEARGLWTGTEIIIKRSELTSIERYAATLLHEIAHARSGKTDITIGFENELTSFLGIVASRALLKPSVDTQFLQEPTNARIPDIQTKAGNDPTPTKKSSFWARLFGNNRR